MANDHRELFDKAVVARGRAHAVYSDFPVGAALRTRAGTVHAGANVENASYPEGWCAETSAIAQMIAASSAPEARRIAEIVVVARRIDGRVTTPCGGCRQRIAEFSDADTLVHAFDPDGNGETFRMADLLPAGFALDLKT